MTEHLEGRQSILAALAARRRKIDVILLRHGIHENDLRELLDLAAQRGVPIRYVEARELDAMTHGSSHGGVVAVASSNPRTGFEELIEILNSTSAPPMLLLLEGVDDARNLGFTLRTAAAMGAHAVLIKKHLWDFDPVEVARPASGAYENLPLVQIDDASPLRELQRRGLKLFGCLAGVKRSIYEMDLSQGIVLAIGGEKRGLSGAVRDICDGFMTIPTAEGRSVSLSHAAAIVLAEAMRQRHV